MTMTISDKPVERLAEVLTEAGLMPLAAFDTAEAISNDRKMLAELRITSGELLLLVVDQSKGLQEQEG